MSKRKRLKFIIGVTGICVGIAGSIIMAVLLPRPLIFVTGWESRTGAPIYLKDPAVAVVRTQWVMAVCNVASFLVGLGSMGLLWPRVDEEIREKGKIEKMMAVAGLLDDLGMKDVEQFIKEKFTDFGKGKK